MAFKFVIEKFALFVRQLLVFLGKEIPLTPHHGYSSFFGTFLIALGAVIGFLAFIRYKSIEKQIDEDTYKPSILLDMLLVILLLVIAIF